MSKYIGIQAGHWNIKYNCITSLQSGTGAPQESGTTVAVAIRLEKILQSKGFKTFLTDANYNCNTNSNKTDFDLFISLHCDANYEGNEGGGFVDFPAPETDYATAESQRIAGVIESVYFNETGIRDMPSRRNNNTKYYYMWASLSEKTPCVLLEMGESVDPHDRVILNDTERVAQAIAKSILKAFPNEVVAPPVEDCSNVRKELETLKKVHENCTLLIQENSSLKIQVTNLNNDLASALEAKNKYKTDSEKYRKALDQINVISA